MNNTTVRKKATQVLSFVNGKMARPILSELIEKRVNIPLKYEMAWPNDGDAKNTHPTATTTNVHND